MMVNLSEEARQDNSLLIGQAAEGGTALSATTSRISARRQSNAYRMIWFITIGIVAIKANVTAGDRGGVSKATLYQGPYIVG